MYCWSRKISALHTGHCFIASVIVWRALYLIMPENSICKCQLRAALHESLKSKSCAVLQNLACASIEGSDLSEFGGRRISIERDNFSMFAVMWCLEVFESSGVQNRGRTPWHRDQRYPLKSHGGNPIVARSSSRDLVPSSRYLHRMVERTLCHLKA